MAVQAIYESLECREGKSFAGLFRQPRRRCTATWATREFEFLFYLWHLNAAKEISGIYFVKIVSAGGMCWFSAR